MKAAVITLALLGLIFFILATLEAGGLASVNGAGHWLVPGGLSCWLLAWLLTLL